MRFEDGYLRNTKGRYMTMPDGGYPVAVTYAEQYNTQVYFVEKRTKTNCAARSSTCHGENQRWKIVYREDLDKHWLKKGDFSEEHGLYVDRPFYIMSRLPSRRYLEARANAHTQIRTPTRAAM